MTTLLDLLTPKTRAQVEAELIASLQTSGFPTTDWTSTSMETALVQMEGNALNDLNATTVPAVAAGGYVLYATGAWLTLLAEQFYDMPRDPPVGGNFTVGDATLTCSASAGPYTITASQLTAMSTSGKKFTNVDGGALASGGTLVLEWVAEEGGTAWNVANGTLTTLVTPLPGVTINNPGTTFSAVTHTGSGTGTIAASGAPGAAYSVLVRVTVSGQVNPGLAQWEYSTNGGASWTNAGNVASAAIAATGITVTLTNGTVNPSFIIGDLYAFDAPGSWITTAGADEETDDELKVRLLARWPSLGDVAVANKYELWALAGGAEYGVRQVLATADPSSAATVNITIAGAGAVVPAFVVTQVQAYIAVRAGITDLPRVAAAGSTAMTLAAGTVRVLAANYTAARTAADANYAAYLAQVGIGGTVRYSQIIEAILRDSGGEDDSVNGMTLNGGTADVALAATNIATAFNVPSAALTWVAY